LSLDHPKASDSSGAALLLAAGYGALQLDIQRSLDRSFSGMRHRKVSSRGSHAHNFGYHPGADADWRAAHMALQRQLGVLPERRVGTGAGSFFTNFIRRLLNFWGQIDYSTWPL
jgi:hypothetical protein